MRNDQYKNTYENEHSNFLGICLGGEKCQQRKALRKYVREDKRNSRRVNFDDSNEYNAEMEALQQGSGNGDILNLVNGIIGKLGTQNTNTQTFITEEIKPTPKTATKKDNTLLYIVGLVMFGILTYLVASEI